METKPNIINFSFLEDFTKGNTGKMAYFIRIYLKTAPKLFNELLNYSIEQDWEEVYLKAHNLKPQVQYMGVTGLKELLVEIETIIKSGHDKNELTDIVYNAVKLNERAVFELNEFVNSNSIQ